MSAVDDTANDLRARAAARFGGLSSAESRLIDAAVAGLDAELSRPDQGPSDWGDPENWNDDECVRAALLRWCCVDRAARDAIDPKGLRLVGARVTDVVDLESVDCPFPVQLRRCRVPGGLVLRYASVPYLDLRGSRVRRLMADHLRCDASVMLNERFTCDEGVSLRGAGIHGNLNANGARVVAADSHAYSLDLTGADVGGAVLLGKGFRALGQVRMYGGSIGGNLECDGARFAARYDEALKIESVHIARNVLLRGGGAGAQTDVFRALGGVRLFGSRIDGNLNLNGAWIRSRRRPALNAIGVRVAGSVTLTEGFVACGNVRFLRATIGGDFNADAARIVGRPDDIVLAFVSATIGGAVLMRSGFRALGQVRLLGGSVGGPIECAGARMAARGDFALLIEEVSVGGGLLLRHDGRQPFRALGGVCTFGSTINGDVDLDGAIVRSRARPALKAEGVKVVGSLLARNARLFGRVDIGKANIGRMLDASGAWVVQPAGESALLAEGTTIGLGVLLRHGFRSIGSIRFFSATVGSTFDCRNARFAVRARYASRGRSALDLSDSRIGGSLLLDSCRALGGLRLAGATIAGDVELAGSILRLRGGKALDARRVTVGRSLRFGDGARARGEIDLSRCSIADHLDLSGAANAPDDVARFDASDARVGGTAYLCEGLRVFGDLLLRGATLGRLDDDEAAWPTSGRLDLDGLTYQSIANGNVAMRLRWLTRQRSSEGGGGAPFSAQPYEQLAQTLRRSGHEADARRIAIAKETALRRSGTLGRWALVRHALYGATMRYGFRPQWSLWYAPLFVLGLTAALHSGADTLMLPTKEPAHTEWTGPKRALPAGYPSFSPLVYAIDTFVPIVSLQQKDYWQVDDRARCDRGPEHCGRWLRNYLWLHTVFGWVITTLAVAGFTGLVRKN